MERNTSNIRDRGYRIGARLIFPAIALFFILARTWTAYPLVFPPSADTQLLGVDSYFHVRHAEYTARHFPQPLRIDPASHYPGREPQQVTGLFNALIAATALIGGGFSVSEHQLARAAAWSTVMLAVIALWVLYRLAFFLAGRRAALFAAAIFTLYPGTSLSRSQLGFADQHVAEFLLAILSIATLTYCLEQSRRSDYPRKVWPALMLSAPFAAIFYTWIGAPMYIAVMAFVLLAVVLRSIGNLELSRAISAGTFRYFSGVVVWMVIVMILTPDLIMELVPKMRWWNLGGMAMFAVLPGLFIKFANDFALRYIPVNGVRALTVTIAVALVYLFLNYSADGLVFKYWLVGARGTDIVEQKVVDLREFWTLFGSAGIIAGFAIFLGWRNVSTSDRAPWKILSVSAGAVLTFLWWKTYDFDYVPPVFVALMASLVIDRFLAQTQRAVSDQKGPEKSTSARSAILTMIVIFVLVIPLFVFRDMRSPWISPRMVQSGLFQESAWFSAMRWMSDNTPEPSIGTLTPISSDASEPYPDGSYGVMTIWDYGNFVSAIGRRPAVTSRYPSGSAAAWMTATSEEEADSLLCPGCRDPEYIRYAVLDDRMAGPMFMPKSRLAGRTIEFVQRGSWKTGQREWPRITPGTAYDDAMSTRLYRYDGLDLKHYRLVFESAEESLCYFYFAPGTGALSLIASPIRSLRDRDAATHLLNSPFVLQDNNILYDAYVASTVKIFEIVEGAILHGSAENGVAVRAILGIESLENGRMLSIEHHVTADSTGQFAFVVPYWTSGVSESDRFRPTGPYQISYGDSTRSVTWVVDVSEEDVRQGRAVRVGQ